MSGWRQHEIDVRLDGREFRIAYGEREAPGADPQTLVYLHGLGSSRRDFEPAAAAPELAGARLLALDLPGSGETPDSPDLPLGIPELVRLVESAVVALDLNRFHLVGHSMGGLVGLLVSDRDPRRIRTFTNVEGNLAPVDCRVFSQRVLELAASRTPEEIIDLLEEELALSPRPGLSQFAARFRHEVQADAFVRYCESIVGISKNVPLLSMFRDLRQPRLFVYGEANRDLPYLDDLRAGGVALAEIRGADHFPLYTNPRRFFEVLGSFLGGIEKS
jgi:pimeloyl-ACP methyl ester carboxylesterase